MPELLVVLLIVAVILGLGAAAKLAWWLLVALALAIVVGWGLAFGGRRR